MKSVMIYGYDRCGTTTLMCCLAKNRIILGEFLYKEWCNHHFVESMVPLQGGIVQVIDATRGIKKFKISNVIALNAIMQSNSVIAKCHLHWAKPEYFDFDGIKIYIHRQDIVDAQLSRQIAERTNIWNATKIPIIDPMVLDVDDFIGGMEQRVDTRYINQPMDYVLDYDRHLPIIIERSGYNLLHNSNKKIYNNKHNLILNYDELMQKAEQFASNIATVNASFKYTDIDNDLEYDKWIASDYIDFYDSLP